MNKPIHMSDILAMTDAELEHLARHGVGGYKTLSAIAQDVVREELKTLGPEWTVEWRGFGFNVYAQPRRDKVEGILVSVFFDDDHARTSFEHWPDDAETRSKHEYASPSFPKTLMEEMKAHLRKAETK